MNSCGIDVHFSPPPSSPRNPYHPWKTQSPGRWTWWVCRGMGVRLVSDLSVWILSTKFGDTVRHSLYFFSYLLLGWLMRLCCKELQDLQLGLDRTLQGELNTVYFITQWCTIEPTAGTWPPLLSQVENSVGQNRCCCLLSLSVRMSY